jgi:hypothetical protein
LTENDPLEATAGRKMFQLAVLNNRDFSIYYQNSGLLGGAAKKPNIRRPRHHTPDFTSMKAVFC